ncbi:MAG: arylesterase [Candidatus Wallbacteria bacterium]|nr:arylesterase [Candidatus Wallbacteria bacterium]
MAVATSLGMALLAGWACPAAMAAGCCDDPAKASAKPAFDPVGGLEFVDVQAGGSGGPIVFLGDSLTQGPGIQPAQAYPALIQQKLRTARLQFKTVNAGVGGNTSAQGLARLDSALKLKPSILVVNFGTNDANLRRAGASPTSEQLRLNIDRIVTRAQARKVQVVLIATRLPSWYGSELVNGFARAFQSVAISRHVPMAPGLLDGVWGHPELWLPNGHPNAAGHRVIAENVWRVLQPVARKLGPKGR